MLQSALLFVASALWLGGAHAADAASTFQSSKGDLPLILTVPHDGTAKMADTPLRKQGKTVRDIGTQPLAEQVAARLEARLGKRPYLVIEQLARNYVDVNRSEQEALESATVLPAYRAYHERVATFVAEVRSRFPGGALLVDVHGQSQEPAMIFRGTRGGLTTQALVRRHGAAAIQGERSIIGILAAKGYKVNPPVGAWSLKEDRRFDGGFTVFNHGSQNANGIDAIQLEFGKVYRDDPQLADNVAEALVVFMKQYGLVVK